MPLNVAIGSSIKTGMGLVAARGFVVALGVLPCSCGMETSVRGSCASMFDNIPTAGETFLFLGKNSIEALTTCRGRWRLGRLGEFSKAVSAAEARRSIFAVYTMAAETAEEACTFKFNSEK